MKNLILLIISVLNFTICKAQSEYVILNDQRTIDKLISSHKVLSESSKTTELSPSEFELVKKITNECIEKYNYNVKKGFKERGEKRRYSKMYIIMPLKKYKIQYVPYLNQNGEKEVWINGFCSEFNTYWRNDIVSVFDGGNCFFTIKINLDTHECLQIGVNGYA